MSPGSLEEHETEPALIKLMSPDLLEEHKTKHPV